MSYAPSTGVTYATSMIKEMTFSKVAARAADDVNRQMWTAAPFRWTIGSLPNVTIIDSTSDYTFTKPADFQSLLSAYIWDGQKEVPLVVEPTLPTTGVGVGQTSRIAYASVSSVDKLRVYPVPTPSAATRTLISRYKKSATTIVDGNLATADILGIPDDWVWVFEAGLLWQAYMFGDDRRAGSAVVTNDGRIQYTEQLGVFLAGIETMKAVEKVLLPWPGKPGT